MKTFYVIYDLFFQEYICDYKYSLSGLGLNVFMDAKQFQTEDDALKAIAKIIESDPSKKASFEIKKVITNER